MRVDKLIALGVVFLFLLSSCSNTKNDSRSDDAAPKEERLPIFGNREFVNGDTVYHQIPDFIFMNQDCVLIRSEDLVGKITIANFFFSTCPSICPVMTKQMRRLQLLLQEDSAVVVFLSHTIDPKTDSIPKLKAFAERYEADLYNWHFLRGDLDYLYEIAKEGYLSTALEDDQAPGGFLHSQYFILVDKEKRIRGLYDGTMPNEVDKLAEDFQILKKEYASK